MENDMTHEEKCRLVQIHNTLDRLLGDTDPNWADEWDDDEELMREEEPLFWMAREIADMIGPAPWDRYTANAKMRGGE